MILFTLLIQNLRSFVLQKSIACLLPYFEADWVLSLLGLLEKFRDFLKTGIGLFFLALGFLYVVEEKLVSLVIDLLRRSLRVRADIVLQCRYPIYFLFGHLKYYSDN